MQLKNGGTYKTRDGQSTVTVEKCANNGTNYIFRSFNAMTGYYSWFLKSGHSLHPTIECGADLVAEV